MHGSHHRITGLAALTLAGSIVVLAATAVAQDYEIETTYSLLRDVPTQATEILSPQAGQVYAVDLPFRFPYYGTEAERAWIATNGFVQLGVETGTTGPFTPGLPTTTDYNGVCAPFWSSLSSGDIWHWTEGSAPDRIFVVHWDGFMNSTAGGGNVTFQAQLHEGTGQIVFAYSESSNWSAFTGRNQYEYALAGLDAPRSGDQRSLLLFYPPTGRPMDHILTPRTTTVTGTAVMDEVEATAQGAGGQVRTAVPASGATVALAWPDGTIAVTGSVASDGSFSLTGIALDGSVTGSLALLADNAACTVSSSSGGDPSSFTLTGAVDFGSDGDLGTLGIGAGVDPGGVIRTPHHVARRILEAHTWVTSHVSTTVPKLQVLHDAVSTEPTAYTEAQDPADAVLRIAGTAATNPDGWDGHVIVRTYGRHVLASLARPTGQERSDGFDEVTTGENAFAVGFGHYLTSVVTGSGSFIDTLGIDTASVVDVEAPSLASAHGTDVAGRVAGFLHDVADPADEDDDRIDGTGVEHRVLEVVEGSPVPVTVSEFASRWRAAGFDDGLALSRSLVHHGLVEDDADEPNDFLSEPAAFGTEGVRRTGLVLNVGNDDVYSVQVPVATDALHAAVVFDGMQEPAVVVLEIRSTAGDVLAATQNAVGVGTLKAATGPVSAGTYHVVVAHETGPRVSRYALQIHVPLSIGQDPLPEWTAGRPYLVPLPMRGGVPPYAVEIEPPTGAPPGINFDPDAHTVSGTTFSPGHYSFTVQLSDAGVPRNQASLSMNLDINPPLVLDLPPYVGLPLGRSPVAVVPHTGGTAPFLFGIGEGELPDGVTLDAGAVRFLGTATIPGSTDVRIDGVDLAGSTTSDDTRVVVCAPLAGGTVVTPLAAGDAACGFFFDAVAGTSVRLGVATSKKRAKRLLTSVVLGADTAVLPDGNTKGGKGKASATITCADSGRYYLVLQGADGEETELSGRVKLTPPRTAKAKKLPFSVGDTVSVPFGALAGAQVTLKANTDAKSGATLRVVALLDPSGAIAPASSYETGDAGTKTAASVTVPSGGTWTFLLRGTGGEGALSWTVKMRQPKGTAYSAD